MAPERASTIRIPLTSRFNRATLAEHLRQNPGMALVTNAGREYVIAGQWRRRSDIAELIEATRGERRSDLIQDLCATLARRGVRLIVLDYGLEALDPAFYRRAGFNLIERIVEYERPDGEVRQRPRAGLTVRPYQLEDRSAILDLERESFEWLWWNSPEEWDYYSATPAVDVIVGCCDAKVIGYASFVTHRRDGHLDRLAVRRDYQGQGYGAGLLTEALTRLRARGAKRVALTTQEDNHRSQALYERYGFHRGRWSYAIHGRWLTPEDESS